MSNSPPNVPENPVDPFEQLVAPQPPPKRRKWPWILLAVLLVLALLVVLAPTIASTGPVRSFVVGRINNSLNGRVSIADWSLGWTSGIKVNGVKVFDQSNALILEVDRLTSQLSLLDAIRGNYNLGDTVIDLNLANAKLDREGRTNYEQLVKAKAPDGPTSSAGDELPNVSGRITVNLRGTIAGDGVPTPVHIEPGSTALLNIPNINSPIDNTVKLKFRVGDEQPGALDLAGKIAAVKNNRLNTENLVADQKLQVARVNLAALNGILKSLGQDVQLGGLSNGSVQLNMQGITGLSSSGQITVENFSVAGELLNGDRFATVHLTIPLHVTRTLTDPSSATIKIEKLGLEMPEATILVSGEVAEDALINLSQRKAPGKPGKLEVAVKVPDLGRIANQLPRTLDLAEGVTIDGGSLVQTSTITLTETQVALAQRADLTASGKQNGQSISLKPVHIDAAAIAIPGGQSIPDLRDIKLAMTSDFATVTGGGASLDKLDITTNFDLAKLQREVGQFVELPAGLQGNGKLVLATRGDVTQTDKPLTTSVKLNLFPAARTDSLVDLDIAADVKLADASVPSFNILRCVVTDLRQFQEQFGALVPALAEQKISIREGSLSLKVAGSYARGTLKLSEPLVVAMPNLSVDRAGVRLLERESINANALGSVSTAAGISANLTDLAVSSSSNLVSVTKSGSGPFTFSMDKNGAIRGNGVITVSSDLRRAAGLALASRAGDQIKSGKLDATISLSRGDQPSTSVNVDGTVTGLTYGAIDNENIGITAKLVSPDDFSALTADAKLSSNFATTTVTGAQVNLTGGTWDTIQKADVDVNVPDLQKFCTLAQGFAPKPGAGEAPVEPFKVVRGSMGVKLNIARDPKSKATALRVADGRINKLEIQRGDGKPYRFDRDNPITFQLSAAVKADQKLESVNVTELAADARVLSVSMPKPITITDLSGKPRAAGTLAAKGSLQNISPVLAIITGSAPLPYEGEFALKQDLRNDNDAVVLAGEITTRQFKVLDPADPRKVLVSEETVAIRNNISVDPSAKVAKINALAIDMPTSGALKLDVTGSVERWGEEADGGTLLAYFNGVVANLTYDLETLWPIVKPLLATPQEPLDGVAVVGKYTKKFEITGPYFDGDLHQALRQLQVVGGFTIDKLVYPGIEVQNQDIPIYLRKGVAQIVYAGKPAAERMPKPALFNGGTISLGGISVDLTQPDPRVSIPEKYKLISRATINPLLSGKLGKFVNPVFANSDRAQGLLDVTVMYCENVAIGEALKTDQSGRAKIVFSISDLDIANPLGSLMLGAVPGLRASKNQADTFRGQIKDAVVTLENGRTTQDLTLLMIDPSRVADGSAPKGKPQEVLMPMHFQGDVRLSDLSQSINVSLPAELLARMFPSEKDQRVVMQIFPRGVPLSLKGTTIKPVVDPGNIAQKFIEGQLQGGLGGLIDQIGGRKKDDDKTNDRGKNR
jgi:hypothetical protein